jgi:hypothetical protein
MGILLWIVVAVVTLAIIGLGWNTFFEGVRTGADKVGITSILENATKGHRNSYECLKGYSWKLAW